MDASNALDEISAVCASDQITCLETVRYLRQPDRRDVLCHNVLNSAPSLPYEVFPACACMCGSRPWVQLITSIWVPMLAATTLCACMCCRQRTGASCTISD